MSIFATIRESFRSAFRLWRLLLILWFANLVLAAVGTMPIAGAIFKAFGHSLEAQRIDSYISGTLVIDLARSLHDAGESITLGVPIALLVMLGFQTLTVGGVLGRIDAFDRGGDGQSTFAGFLADSGRFAWRSIRLEVWGVLLLVPVALLLQGASAGIDAYAKRTLNESPILWLDFVRLVVGAMLFFLARVAIEAARADMVLEERRQMWRSLGRGIQLVWRRPRQLLLAYPLTGLIGLLAFAALFAVRLLMPATNWFGVVLGALLGQEAIFVRLAGATATSIVALRVCRDDSAARSVVAGRTGDRLEPFVPPPWERLET